MTSVPRLLSWTPRNINIDTIDKTSDYTVSLADIDINVTALTPFVDNGLRVRVSGLRLYYLMKNKPDIADTAGATPKRKNAAATLKQKSMKNVCFKGFERDKIVKVLNQKLRMPECMVRFMNDFLLRPRGDRFRKRFIFNSYVANVLTCTKCQKQCIADAMATLYDHDSKCVQEFNKIIFKNTNVYLPPNCDNMKNKDKLCNKVGTCKGKNPVCNF
ncbi:DNA replication and late expression factor LEF-2 [Mamestra configurata nucleopolyhedrovirus B]|uniref:Lef-2 n=1 Tax=Mamestra configurata nucleopolyhedrovirus B TaxID=204440 RepID=Q8JMD9_9ABAC|nr:DNA replication and late expression factor LEF-2 [Mamestra configurata nucleopolyhedrovirus B]AAM95000.1 DNA replication and late expression factor LEF-2 [Mamestra configurata nucleopolyhedrovirus B]QNH90663.1 lef-2 [Mamestra configurata nucleopolyhedrovirus B]